MSCRRRCCSRLAAVVLAMVMTAACVSDSDRANSHPVPTGAASSVAAAVDPPDPDLARGVALSPRSYEGSDLPDYLDIVDGSVDVVMHAGDWAELADETSSFRVLVELATQRDLDSMVVLSPSNGTQLLRPLDDATIDSYLASLRTFLVDFQPRYLGLGNELNLVESRSPAEFEQVVELYEAALPIVRELAPETTVFVTVQYEWFLGRRDGWFGRTNDPSLAQWALLDRFDEADAIGITTYPGLVFETPEEIPADYYDRIRTHTDLPVVITESGWSANPDTKIRAGSLEEQAEWAASLLERADRLESEVAIWTFLFSTQVAEPAFADMGLWADDGSPRPAWDVWRGAAGAAQPPPTGSASPVVGFASDWQVDFPGELPLTALADTVGRPYVYVAAKNGGVAVLAVDGAQGEVVARTDVAQLGGADAMHLAQQGELLVVALGDFFGPPAPAGMAIVDVADPTRPEVLGTWLSDEPLGGVADVVIDGTTVYLGAMEHGVIAIDITNPIEPIEVGRITLDPDFPRANPSAVAHPNARGLAVAPERLYVANDAGGLRVVDTSDPAAMREIGRYINPLTEKQQAYNDVLLVGDIAYVSLDYCGFEVIDISSTDAMSQVAWLDPWDCKSPANLWLNSPGHGNELAFDAARQTMWMSAGDSELIAIDVSNPAAPAISARFGEPGNGVGTYGLAATSGPDAQVFLTYITTIVPFQGRTSRVVALTPE